jgi:hypothetical protein
MSEVLKSLAEVLQVQSADCLMTRVGQIARAIIYTYGVHTIILAGKSSGDVSGCTCNNFGREITQHTVMSEVLKSLAEVLQVQSADCLMNWVAQTRCTFGILCRDITNHTVMSASAQVT